MKTKILIRITAVVAISLSVTVDAENIDPAEDGSQYAYGEAIGWVNFEPGTAGTGAVVSEIGVSGYVWGENIGWINLAPASYGGVEHDGLGNLSGYGWGENVGWINFDPQVPDDPGDYGVKIDAAGRFSGWAWGENIGWINFNSAELHGAGPVVCKVNLLVVEKLAGQWLQDGGGLPADLNENGSVDTRDLSLLADHWLSYCPPVWGF